MFRIRMNLTNPNVQQAAAMAAAAVRPTPTQFRAGALNSSMIGRVHNVKPGCSSCGKKVA
jgi:hypothetical protein